jgi:serine/threonine protein kinase
MAPEVRDPSQNYAFEADLWSIGLILLEMLMGPLPWRNKVRQDEEPYR